MWICCLYDETKIYVCKLPQIHAYIWKYSGQVTQMHQCNHIWCRILYMYGYIYKFTDMFINKEPSTSIWIFEQVSIQPMEMYSFLLARYTNNNIICTITIIYNKITIIFTKGILARYTKTMIDPRLMVKFMIIFTKRNCWVPHFFNTMITNISFC